MKITLKMNRLAKITSATLATGLYLIVSLPATVQAAPQGGYANSDDCYNRATRKCNRKYPGKDWGSAAYRRCIDTSTRWCDKHRPVDRYNSGSSYQNSSLRFWR